MYTSIPSAKFRVAIMSILIDRNQYNEETRSWIIDACHFLWTHTVFQVGPELQEQLDRIPIGIHYGPVFANLFIAYFEKQQLLRQPVDLFYRQYIDDCFAIHLLDELVHSLHCLDLDIVQADSNVRLFFLNVFFYTHCKELRVCFQPFKKALNYYQYILQASSYPISVKKGLVKGELSCIYAILYKQLYFIAQRARFILRLRLRRQDAQALKAQARQV